MDEYQEQKHICKFCNKSFPSGRSLGGHMRSHLISISSADDHKKTQEMKLPKKKLPPLVNGKSNLSQFGSGLRENPKKTNKFPKSSEEDTLLQEKLCNECGKSFLSWKALFGHMKCHSVNGRMANSVDEDSWNGSNNHRKLIVDSQSDNETATSLSCRRKRSDRMIKRYTPMTNSFSLNFLPCVSEIDQQEQEEVALSLIILSRDKGDWGGINSFVVDSSDNSSEFLQTNKIAKTLDKDSKSNGGECLKFKKLRNGKLEPTILNSKMKQSELKSPPFSRNGLKRRKLEIPADKEEKLEKNSLDHECNESEVNSPRNLIKESEFGQLETDSRKNKSRKRKCIDKHDSGLCQDFERESKFTCSICKKAFPSYQALGGHRASHKKFKGCCAPTSENSLETEISPNQNPNLMGLSAREAGWDKNKERECPICFKVFPSGQALGGHKRSHLIADQTKPNPSLESQKPIPEIRSFLDLNLPAPVEEECDDLKPWWTGTGHKHELLLGLLSS